MLLLPATLTMREARDALRMLAGSLEGEADADLAIDGSQLERFDSSALAVLLECRRLAESWGKRFAVQALPEGLAELARLYGIDTLLHSEPAAAA